MFRSGAQKLGYFTYPVVIALQSYRKASAPALIAPFVNISAASQHYDGSTIYAAFLFFATGLFPRTQKCAPRNSRRALQPIKAILFSAEIFKSGVENLVDGIPPQTKSNTSIRPYRNICAVQLQIFSLNRFTAALRALRGRP